MNPEVEKILRHLGLLCKWIKIVIIIIITWMIF